MAALAELWNVPVIAAPMGGGPTTSRLVAAVGEAGGLGLLAAGYKRPEQVAAEIAEVRAATSRPFGVNLFVPGSPADGAAVAQYLEEIAPDAHALGVELGPATWEDDHWAAKVELVLEAAPAMVSFTFGLPPAELVADLQRRGSVVVATVTTVEEARRAAHRGVDALCTQGIEAGAHSGAFLDEGTTDGGLRTHDLVAAVRRAVDTPLIAAGGIAQPHDVRRALDDGATAVQVGTALLRCDESGAHPIHQAALVDPAFATTSTTRSFSGRTARGLTNAFMVRHPTAPTAYPEINNATRPLRAAAAARSDPSAMSLWAGTGHRHAREGPAAEVVDWLATDS